MASEYFGLSWTPGKTIYVAFWNTSAVWRPQTQAFENFNAAYNYATAYLVEFSIAGRADVSSYRSDSLSLVPFAPGIVSPYGGRDVIARYYVQQGVSPNLATDPIIHEEAFQVQFGARGVDCQNPLIDCVVVPGYRKDLTPKIASFWVQVTVNGEPINLSTINELHYCRVAVRREGDGADLFVATSTTLDDQGRFLVEYETPGYVIDRSYWVSVGYGLNGIVYVTRSKPFLGA